MLILLSPAKTLDFDSSVETEHYYQPEFLDDAEYLVNKLRKKSARSIKKMMGISDNLAELNWRRFREFSTPFTPENSKQAVFAFQGDVYQGLKVDTFSEKDLAYTQKHLRILSGLYGILRPLDLMMAYRLEMGTAFKVTESKTDLYKFWGKKIAQSLQNDMENNNDKILINLASQEYFRAVIKSQIKHEILSPHFLEEKGGDYHMISFFAKKARGMMAAYIIKNKIENKEDLKGFDYEDYSFNQRLSDKHKWVFTRKSKS